MITNGDSMGQWQNKNVPVKFIKQLLVRRQHFDTSVPAHIHFQFLLNLKICAVSIYEVCDPILHD